MSRSEARSAPGWPRAYGAGHRAARATEPIDLVELDLELVLLAVQAVPTTKLWDNGPGVGGEVGAAGCLVSLAFFGLEDGNLGVGRPNGQSGRPDVRVPSGSVRVTLELLRDANVAFGLADSYPEVLIPAARASSSLSASACAAAASAAAVMWSREVPARTSSRCVAPVQ